MKMVNFLILVKLWLILKKITKNLAKSLKNLFKILFFIFKLPKQNGYFSFKKDEFYKLETKNSFSNIYHAPHKFKLLFMYFFPHFSIYEL